MVSAKIIYILIIKVNKLVSSFSLRCFLKEIGNMSSMFLLHVLCHLFYFEQLLSKFETNTVGSFRFWRSFSTSFTNSNLLSCIKKTANSVTESAATKMWNKQHLLSVYVFFKWTLMGLQSDWLNYMYTISHQSAVARGCPCNGNIFLFLHCLKEDLEIFICNLIPRNAKERKLPRPVMWL